jgi:hypothetical protein
MEYKIHIDSRKYDTFTYYTMNEFIKINLNINPFENKLFNNDVFIINNKNNCEIIHSTIRQNTLLPGVIILKNNKTFGKHTNNKLLYKFIPDDNRIPTFLIPYEIKTIGFSKIHINKYALILYDNWNNKHPVGILNQVIGNVDELNNFYEYQLYCKSLHNSIQQFTKDTSKSLKIKSQNAFFENIKERYPQIKDRTDQIEYKIISIDPETSVDFDDAISIKTIDSNNYILSVYISNVSIWMDILDIWSSFSKRVSTIYLPDKKRPMLPTILSDCLCSLQENVTRIAFTMDVSICNNKIIKIDYYNSFIKVIKNYRYEEKDLVNNAYYQNIFQKTNELSLNYKYLNNIHSSHEVVSYLMILMNYECAKNLLSFKNGIFRSAIISNEVNVNIDNLPEEINNFIKIWHSSSGKYININNITENDIIRHDLLKMDSYVHITSPIRRLVDLLNIIQIQKNLNMIELSNKSTEFYNNWINKLDYINTTMRGIRKIQGECSLLDLCVTNPDIMNVEYNGYMFDKLLRNDGLYQYIVYLPKLKLTTKITIRYDYNEYCNKKFRLFIFNNEEKFKKKIRLHLL